MNARFCLVAAGIALLCAGTALAKDVSCKHCVKLGNGEIVFQCSDLSKITVYSQQDATKKLGSLGNLIINEHTGQVLYGILDTGIGGKNVIVPWDALHLQASTSDNQSSLTLNKTSDELQNAPTFDKSKQPDFTNQQIVQSIDTFFGTQTRIQQVPSSETSTLSANQMIFVASNLHGLKVYDRGANNEKLGKLTDLVINASTGQVLYGVLNTGMMGKYVAVPWNAFLLEKGQGNMNFWLTLDKTSNSLKTAPTFNSSDISQVASSDWQRSVDDFFGVRTAARPKR